MPDDFFQEAQTTGKFLLGNRGLALTMIFPLEKGMVTHSSLLPGESHGQRSLAGYGPWGRKESEVTERLTLSLTVKTAFLTLGSVWGPGSAGPSPVLLRT